jgi:hypothetical protein
MAAHAAAGFGVGAGKAGRVNFRHEVACVELFDMLGHTVAVALVPTSALRALTL